MQVLQTFLAVFGLLNLAFAGSVYFHSNKSAAVTFYALISVFASLWSLSTLLLALPALPAPFFAIGAYGHYIFGYLAYLSFFWFAIRYPTPPTQRWAVAAAWVVTLLSAVLLAAIPSSHFLLTRLTPSPILPNAIAFAEPGYLLFILSLSAIFATGLLTLAVKIARLTPGEAKRQNVSKPQLGLALLANAVAGTLGILLNLVLPLAGNFSLFYLNPMLVTTALTALGLYNLAHYRLFNARIVLAEFFTAAIWILFLTRLISQPSDREEILLNVLYLASVTVFGVLLVRSVFHEVRQRELIEKQEQELERANARQENLIHFLSHEVKGYLADGVAGLSTIAEAGEGEVSAPLKSLSLQVLARLRTGVDTVLEILQAGDFKKGTIAFDSRPFDLKELVQNTVSQFLPAATAKDLSIRLSVQPADYRAIGDAAQIGKHVVGNLIDNAIKYTPAKGGPILVSLSRSRDDLRLSVKDSGVGIAQEDQPRLFTEGGRGHDSTKMNVHSTGYGLFIAKSVVTGHHGRISAQSAGAGQGSEFIVELPANSVPAVAASDIRQAAAA